MTDQDTRWDRSWDDRPTIDYWREPEKWERYDGTLTYYDPAWGNPFNPGGLTEAGRAALGIQETP